MKSLTLAGILASLALLLGSFLGTISHPQTASVLGAVQDNTFDSANMTSTVFNVGVTPVPLFKLGNIIPVGTAIGNPNRHFGQLELTGTGPVFCLMNSTSTQLNTSTQYSFELISSSTRGTWSVLGFEAAGGGMYDGQVFCESSSGTSTVTVAESN